MILLRELGSAGKAPRANNVPEIVVVELQWWSYKKTFVDM